MIGFLLDCFGRFVAALPLFLVAGFCKLVGDLIFFAMPKRRRGILSNLHHAFPDKPREWHRRIARTSCRRTIEMALYAFASASFSRARIQRHFEIDETLRHELNKAVSEREAGVLMIPHFSLLEAMNNFPALYDGPIMPIGAMYRPLNQPGIDAWVKRTRERFGIKLLSRKDGLSAPMKMIEEQGLVSVLFDQNTGKSGVLTTFFGRLVSATDLPGLIAQRYKTRVGMIYTERTGFWRGTMHLEILDCKPRSTEIVLAGNQWLENKLSSNDDTCADWLWMHTRWRHQDDWHSRFCISSRRNILEETCEYHGWKTLPKKTRYWIRMPNWLGDVVMALPLLRALRIARPDAELTLLVQPQFIPLLERFEIGDRLLPLPKKGTPGYFSAFKEWQHEYPDCYVLFTNSTRGDLEAKCVNAPQRFGITRPGKKRRTLTHPWAMPADLNEAEIHQTRLWEKFFQHYGLKEALDLSPLTMGIEKKPSGLRIGLIPGTENDPSKRWPVSHWRTLIEQMLSDLPEATLTCYGTPRDTDITTQVVKDFPQERVQDMAGKTGLVEFTEALAGLDILICNDTGGMHLANAIGTPVLVIFGPTNPIRTGPIFDAPAVRLQPDGCPPTGGMAIDGVLPERVAAEARTMLLA